MRSCNTPDHRHAGRGVSPAQPKTGDPAGAGERSLLRQYQSALREYIERPGPAALDRGRELAHRCLAEAITIADITGAHHDALRVILTAPAGDPVLWDGNGEGRQAGAVLEGAQSFFSVFATEYDTARCNMTQLNASLLRDHERTEERAKRVANGLFDQTGQLLACVHMALLEEERRTEDAAVRAEKVRRLLFDIEEQIVCFSQELYPVVLEHLGLRAALESLAKAVTRVSGVAVGVESSIDEGLPRAVKIALYRGVEELLHRVIEVARPLALQIRLDQDQSRISCSVCVEGPATDATTNLLGTWASVKAVGGALAIHHESVSGTEIRITIPRGLAA